MIIFLGGLKAVILIIDWVARCSGIFLPEKHTTSCRVLVGHGSWFLPNGRQT